MVVLSKCLIKVTHFFIGMSFTKLSLGSKFFLQTGLWVLRYLITVVVCMKVQRQG